MLCHMEDLNSFIYIVQSISDVNIQKNNNQGLNP